MTITNNVSNYNDISLADKSGLGIRSVFPLHSVVAFFIPIWAVCHAEFISASGFRNKFAVTGS